MQEGNYDNMVVVMQSVLKRCESQKQRTALHHHVPYWADFCPFRTVQQQQGYNYEINRVAHMRRHLDDDAWITSHCLEALVRGATGVHVHVFDPIRGGRLAGLYSLKYVGKSEPLTKLETVHEDDTAVAQYLKIRLIGSCMAMYRHIGGEVVEISHDVKFVVLTFGACSCAVKPYTMQVHSPNPKTHGNKYALRGSTIPAKFLRRPKPL